MDPALPPGERPVDARNRTARFKAYAGISELVNPADGRRRHAYRPWGTERYHFLGLQDCVRILYPPQGTRRVCKRCEVPMKGHKCPYRKLKVRKIAADGDVAGDQAGV